MSSEVKSQDWSKPAAMAIPKGGFDPATAQQGRYGPIFPKTPANYGFSVLAKIIPGREEVFYEYARNIEKTIGEQPDALAPLKLHYLRWVLFPIKGDTYFMYQGISTPTLTNTPKTRSPFSAALASVPCSRISRISQRIGRPIRRLSLDLPASTDARAFSNTAISLCER